MAVKVKDKDNNEIGNSLRFSFISSLTYPFTNTQDSIFIVHKTTIIPNHALYKLNNPYWSEDIILVNIGTVTNEKAFCKRVQNTNQNAAFTDNDILAYPFDINIDNLFEITSRNTFITSNANISIHDRIKKAFTIR